MSLYKRKDSPYYWVRFTAPGGTRIRESCQTKDPKAAAEYEAKLRADHWRYRKLGERPRIRWEEAVSRFLSEKQAGFGRPWADATVKLRNLKPHFSGLFLDQVDESHIADYCARRRTGGASNTTINRDLQVLRHLLRKAHREWKLLAEVLVVSMLSEPKRRVRFLTRAEADILLYELPPHLRVLAAFTLATGLRERNAAELQWSQVDLTRRVCWIHADQHKTRKPHAVPLNGDALALLRGQVGYDLTWVFSHRGGPVRHVNTSAWYSALERAGIENFRWHDLRHTWASWHVQAGTPLHVLQELGGWSTLEMVQRYAHLSAEHLVMYAERVAGPRIVEHEISTGT